MKNAERLYAEVEPTIEQIVPIAMMAAQIYVKRDIGIGAAVRTAFKIWDETVLQLKARKEKEQT